MRLSLPTRYAEPSRLLKEVVWWCSCWRPWAASNNYIQWSWMCTLDLERMPFKMYNHGIFICKHIVASMRGLYYRYRPWDAVYSWMMNLICYQYPHNPTKSLMWYQPPPPNPALKCRRSLTPSKAVMKSSTNWSVYVRPSTKLELWWVSLIASRRRSSATRSAWRLLGVEENQQPSGWQHLQLSPWDQAMSSSPHPAQKICPPSSNSSWRVWRRWAWRRINISISYNPPTRNSIKQ